MDIKLTAKHVYGNLTFYPACPTSELLCQLTGRKTVTAADARVIKALGYRINVVQDVPGVL